MVQFGFKTMSRSRSLRIIVIQAREACPPVISSFDGPRPSDFDAKKSGSAQAGAATGKRFVLFIA